MSRGKYNTELDLSGTEIKQIPRTTTSLQVGFLLLTECHKVHVLYNTTESTNLSTNQSVSQFMTTFPLLVFFRHDSYIR